MGKYKKNKCIIFVYSIFICILFDVCVSNAAGSMAAVETHTGESDISIYVKGIDGDVSDAAVQIGTASCTNVKIGKLSDMKHPVKTLVMLDNSLSIPESARTVNAEILQNIISDRESYEEIAIAVFDDGINYLTEYTSDYTALKAAVNSIAYQDLETHLTDVLYELLSTEYAEETENAYWRIIVISDGVDDKSGRSTKDELYTLLKENPVPIYTVGIRTGKNNEQLADFFALSRLSNADSFLPDEMENRLDVNVALNADRDIVKFSITPQGELMDGSRKTVRITLPSGDSISTEVTMPQQEQIIKPLVVVCMIAILAAVVIVIVIAVLNRNRKKAEADKMEAHTDENDNNEDKRNTQTYRHTQIINDGNQHRNTHVLFDSGTSQNIVLTDVDSPVRTFSFPLKNIVLIGADRTCDIKILDDDYISGQHCTIELRKNKFYLSDRQSSNGTFLNGSRIYSETEIISGNTIQIGDTRLRFEVK